MSGGREHGMAISTKNLVGRWDACVDFRARSERRDILRMRLSELFALSSPSTTHTKMFACKRRVCFCSTSMWFGANAVLKSCFNDIHALTTTLNAPLPCPVGDLALVDGDKHRHEAVGV